MLGVPHQRDEAPDGPGPGPRGRPRTARPEQRSPTRLMAPMHRSRRTDGVWGVRPKQAPSDFDEENRSRRSTAARKVSATTAPDTCNRHQPAAELVAAGDLGKTVRPP